MHRAEDAVFKKDKSYPGSYRGKIYNLEFFLIYGTASPETWFISLDIAGFPYRFLYTKENGMAGDY
jgi:hypothetical protein